MERSTVQIKAVKLNPLNPRIIKDNKFKQLVQSIKDFPEMLSLREIVVDENMVILGGNMRYRACIEAGLKTIDVVIFSGLSDEQKKEFIIKDNANYGVWNWDILANSYDENKLMNWGINVWTPDAYDSLEDEEEEQDEDEDDPEFMGNATSTTKLPKKVIQIEFIISDYQNAVALVNYLKARKVDVGQVLLETMKKTVQNGN